MGEEQLVRAGCGKRRCAQIGHFLLDNFAFQLEKQCHRPPFAALQSIK